MKKLLFGLIAIVMFGFVGNAQDFDVNNYVTKTKVVTNTENPIFQDYLSQNKNFMSSFSYQNEISFNQLNDQNFSIYDLTLSKNEKYTNIYIVHDAANKNFKTYLINKSENMILIYNTSGEQIINIKNLNGSTNYQVVAEKRSCFGKCMDNAEEIMTDDFVGWVAWNYSPGVQLSVAIYCAGKCS